MISITCTGLVLTVNGVRVCVCVLQYIDTNYLKKWYDNRIFAYISVSCVLSMNNRLLSTVDNIVQFVLFEHYYWHVLFAC